MERPAEDARHEEYGQGCAYESYLSLQIHTQAIISVAAIYGYHMGIQTDEILIKSRNNRQFLPADRPIKDLNMRERVRLKKGQIPSKLNRRISSLPAKYQLDD